MEKKILEITKNTKENEIRVSVLKDFNELMDCLIRAVEHDGLEEEKIRDMNHPYNTLMVLMACILEEVDINTARSAIEFFEERIQEAHKPGKGKEEREKKTALTLNIELKNKLKS